MREPGGNNIERIFNFKYPYEYISRFSELKERMSIADSWILPDENIRAHEFHYWDSTDSGSDCLAVKPDGKRKWECIHMEENLVAGYPHLYYPSCKEFAERFVEKCRSGYRE